MSQPALPAHPIPPTTGLAASREQYQTLPTTPFAFIRKAESRHRVLKNTLGASHTQELLSAQWLQVTGYDYQKRRKKKKNKENPSPNVCLPPRRQKTGRTIQLPGRTHPGLTASATRHQRCWCRWESRHSDRKPAAIG